MKKITILLLLTATFAKSNAQWNTSGTNIYNSNSGRVGIGTANPLSTQTVQSLVPSASVVYPLSVASLAPDAASGAGVGISFFTGGNYTESQRAEQARITVKQNYYGVRPSFTISTTDYNSPYTQFIDRFTIDPQGNVGIGAASNNNKLQIGPNSQGFNGNDLVISNSSSYLQLAISNASSYSTIYGNGDVAIQSGYGKWALYAKADGNVGIGTTSPDNLLQIHSSNAPTLAIGKGNQNTNGKSSLLFNAGDGTAFNGFWINYLKTASTDRLGFVDGGGVERLSVLNGGNVGIGTTNPGSYKLAVEGKIGAREVNVIATNPWPDYVFEKNYKLPSLGEIKNYIDQNQHLPEVPTAKEVEKSGVNLGEMNALLLKKIEELTLYVIELKKENTHLQEQTSEIKTLKEEIRSIKNEISRIK